MKKTRGDKALQFLQHFVEENRYTMENDEPIQGSDAVDYLVNLWNEAAELVK